MTQWYKTFRSAASLWPMFVYAGRVMLSGLIIMWFSACAENQFVQAGPLAEAVEKAKAAAGVTDEKAASEQGVGQEGFQPALARAFAVDGFCQACVKGSSKPFVFFVQSLPAIFLFSLLCAMVLSRPRPKKAKEERPYGYWRLHCLARDGY